MPIFSRLPFLIVMAAVGVATILAGVAQLGDHVPLSPWESGIAMEAVRLNAGQPVYEAGHATHMYGPLLTLLVAGVFRMTGLNLPAARVAMSIVAFALTALLVVILSRNKSRDCAWLAACLFLGINLRTNLVFFSIQPDCAGAFCGIFALYLWATAKGSALRSSASIVLFVSAMLFKQTAAVFALVPIVYAMFWVRPTQWRRVAMALLPVTSILLTLVIIRILAPQMFAAMVTVPASIKVYPDRAWRFGVYLLATFPIFLLALWSLWRNRSTLDERERWILAALAVLLPIGVWTMCKAGSDFNSLLFAYLAMSALAITQIDRMFDWLRSLSSTRRLLVSLAIAALLFFSVFSSIGKSSALSIARQGDERYDVAIAVAQKLGVGVVSPQDPTLAYRASGYIGRSLFFEMDAHAVKGNWPNELPASILEELKTANYVIAAHGYVPTPVFDDSLALCGFRLLNVPELTGSAYQVWGRDR